MTGAIVPFAKHICEIYNATELDTSKFHLLLGKASTDTVTDFSLAIFKVAETKLQNKVSYNHSYVFTVPLLFELT